MGKYSDRDSDAAAWAQAGQRELKARVLLLELQLKELYLRLGQGEPPEFAEVKPPPKEKGYRQPGVTW